MYTFPQKGLCSRVTGKVIRYSLKTQSPRVPLRIIMHILKRNIDNQSCVALATLVCFFSESEFPFFFCFRFFLWTPIPDLCTRTHKRTQAHERANAHAQTPAHTIARKRTHAQFETHTHIYARDRIRTRPQPHIHTGTLADEHT